MSGETPSKSWREPSQLNEPPPDGTETKKFTFWVKKYSYPSLMAERGEQKKLSNENNHIEKFSYMQCICSVGPANIFC